MLKFTPRLIASSAVAVGICLCYSHAAGAKFITLKTGPAKGYTLEIENNATVNAGSVAVFSDPALTKAVNTTSDGKNVIDATKDISFVTLLPNSTYYFSVGNDAKATFNATGISADAKSRFFGEIAMKGSSNGPTISVSSFSSSWSLVTISDSKDTITFNK
jgi:hypothetical protein